ncbi:MAG: hypothetical protein ACOYMQ_09590 [Pseudanabaena sp.]
MQCFSICATICKLVTKNLHLGDRITYQKFAITKTLPYAEI